MKHTLIIVDLQYDFCHPDGTLYVKGGKNIIKKIDKIISNFNSFIFTIDFHPSTHCSFLINGGTWPTHCVIDTIGASIPLDIIQKCDKTGSYNYYCKGMYPNIEEYGAFGDNAQGTEQEIKKWIQTTDSDFVICGVAGDYCVLETIKNLLKLVPKERVSVFLEGIVSIDGGTKLQEFIKTNNIKIYKNDN